MTGFPNGSTADLSTDTLTFSTFGELASYAASHDSAPMYLTTFTRDRGGRITEKVEVIGGTTGTFTYAYDGAGRLVEVVKNGGVFEHYNYDGSSNRTTWTDPWGSHSATVDDQDRVVSTDTATYTYNANGELQSKTAGGNTVSYEFDVSGQLLGVDLPSSVSIDCVLDASNRRVGKRVNGALVQGFLYSGVMRSDN